MKAFVVVAAVLCGLSVAVHGEQVLHGRVYMDNRPVTNTKVRIYHYHWTKSARLLPEKLIAERTLLPKDRPRDAGYYEVKGLPHSVPLLVVAVHDEFPSDPAVEKVTLREGETRKVILNIMPGRSFRPRHE